MLPLEKASRDIQLWTTIQVIDGFINTKQTHRLKNIYDVLQDQIDEHTKGMGEFTVEDFVNYSNHDLERAGFKRHGEPNDKGEVLYLIPLVLYPIMPQELKVFDIDDTEFAHPKTMKKLLKSMVGKNVAPLVAHGILVQAEYGTDKPYIDHITLKAMFDSANLDYGPDYKNTLKVAYDNGVVTASVSYVTYDKIRYDSSCTIDLSGETFELNRAVYVLDAVKAFIRDMEDALPVDYSHEFDAWKTNYLNAVQKYLYR